MPGFTSTGSLGLRLELLAFLYCRETRYTLLRPLEEVHPARRIAGFVSTAFTGNRIEEMMERCAMLT
jgi:hypothetical protein